MAFRVTSQTFFTQLIANAQSHQARLAVLQQQASTGLRVQKPSDDPVAMRTLLSRKSADARVDVQVANIEEARAQLNLSVSQLLDANNVLVRAKDVALQAPQSTETEILAQELDTLIDSLLSIVNAQQDGRYLYGGTASQAAPFRITLDADGQPAKVVYTGADDRASIAIGTGLTVDTSYAGAEVFQQLERGDTIFVGGTGAAAGSGTDSATGLGTLIVRHTITSYAPGSGIAAGSSSATGDTIIGAAGVHTLTVNDTSGTGAFGTASLNGGPAVDFTNGDTDLLVTGAGGEAVYVDTTAITPGFNGVVSITADGTLSVDGGATEVAIDFSGNQVVTHATTGAVTHVDSTGIGRSGTAAIEYPGTADALATLIALRDDLRNTRNLTDSQWQDAITRRIEDVDRVREGVMSTVGEQSVALENLDSLQLRAEQLQLETRTQISELESADLSQVVIELQNEQNLLQFTFATSVGLLDQSLLDFLR